MASPSDQIYAAALTRIEQLLDAPSFKIADGLPQDIPEEAVYLFSERGEPLYVGRTGGLRKRLLQHTWCSHSGATFAFILARKITGRLKPSYTTKDSRADLLKNDEIFKKCFKRQLKRIKRMDVQWVEEPDQVTQAVLEVFAAVETGAKYNKFDNT